jgi:hypothetical protein
MRVVWGKDTSVLAGIMAFSGGSQLTIAECSLCDEQELIFDVDELKAFDDLVCKECLRSGTEEAANRALDLAAVLRARAEDVEALAIRLRQGRLRIDGVLGGFGKLMIVAKGDA